MTLRERLDIQQLASDDPEFLALHIERCKRDPSYFINTCLNIFEPRETSGEWSDLPYLLRGFQEDTVGHLKSHIDGGKDLLIDKTREMGVTWLVLAVYLHYWLFDPKFTSIVGSITEQKIDHKDNPNCLLWKFDYMVDSLRVNAPYFAIEGYRDQNTRCITHMKRVNPNNDSIISGEVMGPNWGRSGRAKTMFGDEFAEAASPASAYASSSRSSPSRIFVFTPKGMNFAGRLACPKKGQKRAIDKISLHWMIDPTKNAWEYRDGSGNVTHSGHGQCPASVVSIYGVPPKYPWYEDACARLGWDPVAIAQELDIDYNQSYEGQMYPQIERSRIMPIEYDPVLPLYCSMDYGLDDMTALVWWQWSARDRRFRAIDAFQARGKTIRWYIPFITGTNLQLGDPEGGYSPFDLEVIKRHEAFNGRYSDFFGDPAGKQRNQVTATSVIQVLGDHGIHVRTNPKANANHVRKFAVQCLLPFCDFGDPNCDDLVQAMRDSRLKPDGTPVHGPESHYRTAVEFFAVNQPHGLTGEDGLTISSLDLEIMTASNEGHVIATSNAGLVRAMMTREIAARDKAEELALQSRARGGRMQSGGWGRRRR